MNIVRENMRHLNDDRLLLSCPKCAKKISPTPLQHHHLNHWYKGGLIHADPNVSAKTKTHPTRQWFPSSCLNLIKPWDLKPKLPSLSWQAWYPEWSIVVVAASTSRLNMLCFRDALLYNLLVYSSLIFCYPVQRIFLCFLSPSLPPFFLSGRVVRWHFLLGVEPLFCCLTSLHQWSSST